MCELCNWSKKDMEKDESTWDERLPKPPKANSSIIPLKQEDIHIHVHVHFDGKNAKSQNELADMISKAVFDKAKMQGTKF